MTAKNTPSPSIVGDVNKPSNSDERYTQVTRKRNGMVATNKGKSVVNGGVQHREMIYNGWKGADRSKVQTNMGATVDISQKHTIPAAPKSHKGEPSGVKKAPNQAPKAAPKAAGFNFTRAVQGSHVKAALNQQNVDKTTPAPTVNKGVSTSNRFAALGDDHQEHNGFSVLDFAASVKTHSLVGGPISAKK